MSRSSVASSKDRAVTVLSAMLDLARTDEFLSYLSPTVSWTIPGNWRRISGTKDRAEIEDFVRVVMPAGFPHGVDFEVHKVVEDDSTVLVELTATATTSKDRAYCNSYCFALDFDGEQVVAIREYMDTLYADAVLHR